ncbi:MAG TPA: polysaccharide biosynthesis protein [Bacteroidetes bacterium]|nr:polysaccharide biosynthesis protein [Bacteroidota bacterium]
MAICAHGEKIKCIFSHPKPNDLGIIRKQSISGTIYSYLGVILGFVIMGILFPRVLSTKEVGLLRVMVSYATLFAQFAGLGFGAVTIKIFPHFRDAARKHHGFLGIALMVALAGFLIAAAVYLLLRPYLVEQSLEKSELFITYFYYVVPLIFFTLLFNVFDNYYRVLYNAVKGIYYKEVIQRAATLVVILLFYFKTINFHQLVILYVLVLISPSLMLLVSLIRSKQLFLKPDLKFITPDLRKQMINVGFFGILASFSGVLVMNIDILMVNNMLGLSAAGIYAITFYFGTLILVPLRTMGKISSVIISDAWKINDKETINDIYRRSSISLSVVGVLLFIGIWGNIDNVFHILGDKYLPGRMVIFFIGMANLFDIAVGISSHIIVNSKYYRSLSYFLLVFAVILVVSNLLLIPVFGLVGAAIASFISKFLYNSIKFVFLYRKFRFQPLSYHHILLILIAILAYWISTFIPTFSNYIVDIIIRSGIIFILFAVPVYYFRISEDINQRVDVIFKKITGRQS